MKYKNIISAIVALTTLSLSANDSGPPGGFSVSWDSFWKNSMAPENAFEFSIVASGQGYLGENANTHYTDSLGRTSIASVLKGSVSPSSIYGATNASGAIDGSVWLQLAGAFYGHNKTIYGGGPKSIGGDVNLYVGALDTTQVISNIYGGASSTAGSIGGNVNLVIDTQNANAGVKTIYGSGIYGSYVAGDVNVSVLSGKVTNSGGAIYGASSNVGGDLTINLGKDAFIGGNVYAGGAQNKFTTIGGKSTINVAEGAYVDGGVYGAGYAGVVSKGVEININGTVLYGVVGAGGNNPWTPSQNYVGTFDELGNPTNNANVNINIGKGAFIRASNQAIMGGGFGDTGNPNSMTGAVTGDTFIKIDGGVIGRDGYASTSISAGGFSSTVHGNGNILIDTSTNTVDMKDNVIIYAAGISENANPNQYDGTIQGNSNVYFTGLGSNLNFTTAVYGRESDNGNTGRVLGDAIFNFGAPGKSFVGDFNANILYFDILNVHSNSNVNITKNIYVADKVFIDRNARLNIAKGASIENVANMNLAGVLSGHGEFYSVNIVGAGGRFEVGISSSANGTMLWNDVSLKDVNLVFDVISVTEYSKVSFAGSEHTISFDNVKLTITANNDFDFAELTEGDRFYLFTDINEDVTIVGSISSVDLPTLGEGLYWDISNILTEGYIVVTTTQVIPEPANIAFVVGLLGLGFAYLRKRNSKIQEK